MSEQSSHPSVPVLRRLWLVVLLTVLILTFPLALLILVSGPVYRWREIGWKPISNTSRWVYAGTLGLWLVAAIGNAVLSPITLKEHWTSSYGPAKRASLAKQQSSDPPPPGGGVKATNTDDGLPACDNLDIIETAKSAIEEGPAGTTIGLRFTDVGKGQETLYEPEKKVRRCVAQAVLNTGGSLLTYQVMVGPSGKLLVQAQIGETADMQYEVDKAKREMAASQSASQQRSQAQHEAGDNQASNAGAGMVATEPTSAGRKSNSAEDKYSANYNRCMNSGEAAQGVTNALAQCLSDELTLQDVRLNTAYKAVMADLEPERQSSLRGAQRQWIKDRDSKCEAENQSGGTMDRLGRLSCHLDSTITRTEELQKMADQ